MSGRCPEASAWTSDTMPTCWRRESPSACSRDTRSCWGRPRLTPSGDSRSWPGPSPASSLPPEGKPMETILVAGAGLVGSLLSIYLARLGHQVQLFDRYPDFREAEAPGGKSINLTLCERGFAALDRVGVGDRVRSISVPCYGRVIHGVDGTLEYQPYGTRREAIHSVSRNHLNRVLLGLAMEQPTLECHFKKRILEVDLTLPSLT